VKRSSLSLSGQGPSLSFSFLLSMRTSLTGADNQATVALPYQLAGKDGILRQLLSLTLRTYPSQEMPWREPMTPSKMPVFLAWTVALICLGSLAQAGQDRPLETANRHYAQAIENRDLQKLKQSLDSYEQAAAAHPDSYEANWKAARSCRFYAEFSKRQGVEGWEELCARFGKKGMRFAQRAFELEPDKVEGHFFYGLCVGTYSDGVSIFTALKEGLKDKTRKHLERAYEIDKHYRHGTPALALGRYWEILPWLAGQDTDKALEYYREAQEIMPQDSRFRPELNVYLGGLLLEEGRNEDEARQLLQAAAASGDPYFSRQARDLLE